VDEEIVGPDSTRIRVLIVDDHELFRRGLALTLGTEHDVEVVGEAGDGAEAVAQALALEPDVVLMDIRMPGTSGIEAARRIRAAQPDVRIVMLTVSEDEEDLFASIRAGASGYLLKELSIDEVAATVRAVHRGQSLISPSMATKLLAEFNTLSRRVEEERGLAPRLTDRELEVLRLLARGMPNREIATELHIAENTVKNHVRNILEKLKLRSRMEAALYAVREKIVDPA
jgi:two-component system NarL family response regulator